MESTQAFPADLLMRFLSNFNLLSMSPSPGPGELGGFMVESVALCDHPSLTVEPGTII